MPMKFSYLLVLILIMLSISVSGCTDITGNNGTNKSSTGGTFENMWVKFHYPSELVILDNSNNTTCKIEIYNSSNTVIENMVGEIFYYQVDKIDQESFTKAKRISIDDKSGIKIEDGLQVCCYVYLTSEYTDVETMILNFDAHNYRDAYQKIADTIEVKKIPS